MQTAIRFSALVMVLGAWTAVNAQQQVLGPMGGVGGEARRIEQQASSPATPKRDAVPDQPAPPKIKEAAVTAGAAGPVWDVQNVKVAGDVAFAERQKVKQELEGLLADGGPKSQQQIQEALRQIFGRMIDRGFYLARVSLMPKNTYDPATKTLSVLVEEGLFGDVKVQFEGREDGRWFSRDQLVGKFKDMQSGQTFNYKTLYDTLSEVNAHPDLTLDSKISVRKPIEGQGDDRRVVRYADIDLTVKESMPLHAIFDVNNYGIEAIDEWQTSLTLQYLNLTKADDVLTISPAMSLDASLVSLAGSYMRPHHIWKGGATTLYAGWSDLDTDDIVPNIDLEGNGWFLGLVHSYTLLKNDDHLVSLSGGIVYRYIEDQFSAFSTELQERNVSVLPLSIALSYSARRADFLRGRNFATVQGVYNVSAGGDNDLEDMWVGAEDNYWIGRLQLARLQPLFGSLDNMQRQVHQWILFLKAEGQYTSSPLIPAEKLSLGGYNTVRGYQTKGYLGDNGVYGTIELRTPILLDLFSKTFGRETQKNPLDRLQFVTFTDFGFLEFEDPLPGVDESETLMSVGAGLRLAVTQYSQLRLDVGVPVVSASGEDDSSEYYLDWQLQF